MNENSEGRIDPFRLLNTRRKNRQRKPLRPKTKARALYEELNPCISTRIPQSVYLETLLSAKTAGLKLNQYVSKVLSKSNLDIEKIKNDAHTAGQQSRQQEIDKSYNRGVEAGKNQKQNDVIKTAEDHAMEKIGLTYPCSICGKWIYVEKGDKLHLRILNLLYQENWCHKYCIDLQSINNRRYD
ncbi:Uncharacterised protein [uncultured archaeon]|nr:Uncharacterised protein [uncultured archaeon]